MLGPVTGSVAATAEGVGVAGAGVVGTAVFDGDTVTDGEAVTLTLGEAVAVFDGDTCADGVHL